MLCGLGAAKSKVNQGIGNTGRKEHDVEAQALARLGAVPKRVDGLTD
jgi:hypothetical protein